MKPGVWADDTPMATLYVTAVFAAAVTDGELGGCIMSKCWVRKWLPRRARAAQKQARISRGFCC